MADVQNLLSQLPAELQGLLADKSKAAKGKKPIPLPPAALRRRAQSIKRQMRADRKGTAPPQSEPKNCLLLSTKRKYTTISASQIARELGCAEPVSFLASGIATDGSRVTVHINPLAQVASRAASALLGFPCCGNVAFSFSEGTVCLPDATMVNPSGARFSLSKRCEGFETEVAEQASLISKAKNNGGAVPVSFEEALQALDEPDSACVEPHGAPDESEPSCE